MDFYDVQDLLDRVNREVTRIHRGVRYDLNCAYPNGTRATVVEVKQLRKLLEEAAAELKEGGF